MLRTHRSLEGLLCNPVMKMMNLTGENRSTLRKTCPSATLSTTNPTWTDPGSNPGLCGERSETNRLSHGTANYFPKYYISFSLSNGDGLRSLSGRTEIICIGLIWISFHRCSITRKKRKTNHLPHRVAQ
jgi:hypothetical protein